MDPLIIVAVVGFAGICVAAAAPIMLATQARSAAEKAEHRAEESRLAAVAATAAARDARLAVLEAAQAARDAHTATTVVGEQVTGLSKQIDGNLTEMIRLAKAAAAAEARADEKQRGVDTAIEVARAAADELQAAKDAPVTGTGGTNE
jgi:predicted  nucleic acid-binding Zn-ribbon protein